MSGHVFEIVRSQRRCRSTLRFVTELGPLLVPSAAIVATTSRSIAGPCTPSRRHDNGAPRRAAVAVAERPADVHGAKLLVLRAPPLPVSP